MDTKTSNEETHSSYKDNNGNLNHLSLSQKEPLHEQLKQYKDNCEETANKMLQKNNFDRYILNSHQKHILWINIPFLVFLWNTYVMFFLFNSDMRMADEVKTAMEENASLSAGKDYKIGLSGINQGKNHPSAFYSNEEMQAESTDINDTASDCDALSEASSNNSLPHISKVDHPGLR